MEYHSAKLSAFLGVRRHVVRIHSGGHQVGIHLKAELAGVIFLLVLPSSQHP